MIKTCKLLDDNGFYKASDALFKRYVESQFIQPSNNQNAPIETRMVPWRDIEDSFKQRDKDWFTKTPSLRTPEYMALPGVFEPEGYAADGGTNNLPGQKRKEKFLKRIHRIKEMLVGYDLMPSEKKQLQEQLDELEKMYAQSEYMVGSPTDMQGPDQVPGPRQVIIDHSSPSMMGLEDFTWEKRRDVNDNASNSYKNLLPN
jgi:hypothetical protein